eukprot:274500-Chlamydomonas_euryale.AAC.2
MPDLPAFPYCTAVERRADYTFAQHVHTAGYGLTYPHVGVARTGSMDHSRYHLFGHDLSTPLFSDAHAAMRSDKVRLVKGVGGEGEALTRVRLRGCAGVVWRCVAWCGVVWRCVAWCGAERK